MQDIDWCRIVHGPDRCQEPMWVEEKGTSADPADTAVICACGKRLSLQDLFQVGRLGSCSGERPWLLVASFPPLDCRWRAPAGSPYRCDHGAGARQRSIAYAS
jgi:hypothetical protein